MALEGIIIALLVANISVKVVCHKQRVESDRQKFIESGAIRCKLDKLNRDVEILQDLIGNHETDHSILEMDIQKLADELEGKIKKEIWCMERPSYIFVEGMKNSANRNNEQ